MLNLIAKLRDKFINDQNPNKELDEQMLDSQQEFAQELQAIKNLLDNEQGGKVLKDWVIERILKEIQILLPDQPHLRAYFDLYNKLSINSALEGLRKDLEAKLEE